MYAKLDTYKMKSLIPKFNLTKTDGKQTYKIKSLIPKFNLTKTDGKQILAGSVMA